MVNQQVSTTLWALRRRRRNRSLANTSAMGGTAASRRSSRVLHLGVRPDPINILHVLSERLRIEYEVPPVTRDDLNYLETVLFDSSSSDGQMSCVVCLEDFQKDETIKKLPCNHKFHISCIDHWLKINGTCPLCRSDINIWLMGRLKPDG